MLVFSLMVGVVSVMSVTGQLQGCSDAITNCSTTGPVVCEDRTYAETNCKEYCLLCVDFTLPPYAPCIDLSPDCDQVNCSMNPITNFAKINCRKKCGVCQEIPVETSTAATPKETELTRPVLFQSTTERCVDQGMNCTGDSCTTQFGWEYCRETCGLCGNDSTFPAAPTTTTIPTTTTTMMMTTTSAAMITGFRCVDLNDNCTQDDCDAPDYIYARVYCVESCMLCNNETLPGTESPKPTTAKPTTAKPTTAKPTTAKPTTAKPTTAKPTTAKPTTAKPTTAKPTTAKPTTAKPTTAKPTTTGAPATTSKPSRTSRESTTTVPSSPEPQGHLSKQQWQLKYRYFDVPALKGRPGPIVCSPTAELVFVLDASSSVGGANFQTILGFTQNVTERLKSDYDKLNVTVITFSNKPQVAVSFNQDADLSSVLKAEANVTYTHGGTQTDTALALMTQQYNFGNSNQKVAIVITDGASFDPAKTRAQAQLAKDKGVTIFAIAVGDDVNPVETKAISSDPDSRYHYILSTFSGLQAIVDELHVNDCKTTTTEATTTVKETVPTQTVPPVTVSLGPQTAAPQTPSAVPVTVSAVPKPETSVKQETPVAVITTTTEPPKTAAPAITSTEPPKTVTPSPVTITTVAPTKTASPIVTNKPATVMTTTTEPPSTASPVTVTTGAPITLAPSTKVTAKPQTLAPSTEQPSATSQSPVSTQAPSTLPSTTVTSLKPETLAPSPSTTQLSVSTGAPVQISTNSPPKQSSTIINTLKPGTISPSPKTTQKPATASPATVTTVVPVTRAPTTATTVKPETLAPTISTTQLPSTESPVPVSTQAPSKQPSITVTSLKPDTLAPVTTTTEKITASPATISTQAPSKLPPTSVNTLKPNTQEPSTSTTVQQSTASPIPISSESPSKLPSSKLTTLKPNTLAPTQTTTTAVEVTTSTEGPTSTAAPVKVTTQSPATNAPITTTTAKPQTQAPVTTSAAPITTTKATTSAPVSSSSAASSANPPSTSKPSTPKPATLAPNTVTTMTPGTKAPTTEKVTNATTTKMEIVTSTSAPQTASTMSPGTLSPSSSAKPQTLAPSSSTTPQTLAPSSSSTTTTLAPSPPSTESPATLPPTTVTNPPAVTTTTEQITTTTEKPATTTASCIAKVADIVFVVDSSGSIGENNFNVVKQFIKDVVNTFDVDERYTRVGLVEFSSTANIEFKLTDHTNLTDLEQAIDAVTYSGGGTLTSDALELMRIEGFERERPLAPDVAIVITDGLSKYPAVTQAQANLAKGDGITMFSIGIGNESVQSELVAIASDKRFVFQVGDFSALTTLDNVIAHTACGVILPETYQNRSTTARPTTPSGCVDIDSNCESYPRDSCTDFEPYARAHCPKSCGFCPGFPIVNPDCKDNIDDCDSYGTDICYDPLQYSWVEKNCLASCGFCEDKSNIGVKTTTVATTVTTQAVCEDKVKNCVEYGGPSVCTDPAFKSWVKKNCRKFCGICYTYQYVTAVPLGKENCPAWTVPEECKLEYKAGQCCPFPVCPSGYRLAVRRA